jgi:hypothetical protein
LAGFSVGSADCEVEGLSTLRSSIFCSMLSEAMLM